MVESQFIAEFRQARPRYERFTVELHQLLEKILSSFRIRFLIESRTKDVQSFVEKISRPGKSYVDPLREITDLAGVRVVVHSLTDVGRVSQVIRSEFVVDPENSVNKADVLDPDRFGYLSQHFIVTLLTSRQSLAEWSGVADLRAEIQVRTTLQHAWSLVQHPLDYKSSVEAPRQLRRRLFRLSALFELADTELDALFKEAQEIRAEYASEVTKAEASIPIDIDSLRAYMETSDEFRYWEHAWTSIPNTQTMPPNLERRDVLMPLACGLRSMGDYNGMLRSSRGWGEEYARQTLLNIRTWSGRRPPDNPISTTRNGILLYLLIGNFPDVLTADILRGKYGMGPQERTIEIARSLNPRFSDVRR